MQIVVMLLMLLAIAAAVDTRQEDRNRQFADQAASIATQMAWYHTQAVIQCSAPNPTCPTGQVSVPASKLPNGARMAYAGQGGQFVSGTDGTMVVTTWVPANVGLALSPMALGGLVAAALRDQSQGSIYAGAYDARNQTINGANMFQYQGQTGSYTVSLAPGFGGLSLADGEPVIATRVR